MFEAAFHLSLPHKSLVTVCYAEMKRNVQLSLSNFRCIFSDCEISDVTEVVKDERLADKLYTETLRVLKLD